MAIFWNILLYVIPAGGKGIHRQLNENKKPKADETPGSIYRAKVKFKQANWSSSFQCVQIAADTKTSFGQLMPKYKFLGLTICVFGPNINRFYEVHQGLVYLKEYLEAGIQEGVSQTKFLN